MVKVQDARGIGRKALVKQAPHNPRPPSLSQTTWGAFLRPWRVQRFEPETRLEGVDIPQDSHEPALRQPGDHLAVRVRC